MSHARARKLVVAGLLVDGERVLVSQRPAHKAHPLEWEFPGGKIEPGEAPEVALARELREELGVRVHVGRIWDVLFHAYPEFDVLMLVYACTLAAGETPHTSDEVNAFAWARAAELRGYAILPADAPLIARLEREGVPTA